jgi:predicted DsbA family dithiol-disulfide isomerase
MKKLKIEIVSDIMCPWCIIGYKNLAAALDQLEGEIEAEISWKPFELNPNMPVEGQDLAEHLAQKYGLSEAQGIENRNRILDMGERAGFSFNFSGDQQFRLPPITDLGGH